MALMQCKMNEKKVLSISMLYLFKDNIFSVFKFMGFLCLFLHLEEVASEKENPKKCKICTFVS